MIKTMNYQCGQFLKTGLTWELPLGTIRGQLEEPGPRFVDPYVKAEREAIHWLAKEESKK